MNGEYLQNLRYKLQKRVRKLNSTNNEIFHYYLIQFWGFLQSNQTFVGILIDLENKYPEEKLNADKIVSAQEALVYNEEMRNVALSYFVIKDCVNSDKSGIECNCVFQYAHTDSVREALDEFRALFLEPLYEYIDEQLDDQKAVLMLLTRYKHKCEWFQREYLYKLWDENTSKGEKLLAMNLYEYLYDQGLDIIIEPRSASGEADLVSSQKNDEPLIADVKIFNPEKGHAKDYLAKGFNQIYQYTMDYNEPFGYMVIFKTCEDDLKLSLDKKELSTPLIIHNNKTIFLLTIDIFIYEKSASKRGVLKTTEITEEEFIRKT